MMPAAFYAPPPGAADPLYTAAARFAAARHRVGPVGLARRFNIGRRRAAVLLDALDAARVLIGPGHRGVWVVNSSAWASLLAVPA
jgi:DNA segregation ATPase FtsK/SpoIIIE-like protein